MIGPATPGALESPALPECLRRSTGTSAFSHMRSMSMDEPEPSKQGWISASKTGRSEVMGSVATRNWNRAPSPRW